MQQRIFYGKLTPADFARSLSAHFHRGNLRVRQIGQGAQLAIQIATSVLPSSGGQTALTISLQEVEDGVAVKVGKQAMFGVAASLGITALSALRNPMRLLSRLDDLAQDLEYLQLTDEVWRVIHSTAQALGAGHQLSERLRRLECAYCGSANPVGEPNCVMCGAPLGSLQPATCSHCGFVPLRAEKICPNCQQPIN
ncbi:MAG: hypothetical protein U1B80_06170 [Anaerolineaceae bacterium]|nr:hypothetical protein [Anaerolineaceae bacterium]